MRSFDWKNIYRASAAGLAVALAQISITPVQAADYDVGSIHIAEPWTRATPKGASSGAAYVTIANKGTVPDRVTCMSSESAPRANLKPSGLHLMLMDLKHPLEQGKMVEATLHFEKAGTIKIEFPVAATGAQRLAPTKATVTPA